MDPRRGQARETPTWVDIRAGNTPFYGPDVSPERLAQGPDERLVQRSFQHLGRPPDNVLICFPTDKFFVITDTNSGSAIQVMLCLKRAAKTYDYPVCCRGAFARQHYLGTTTGKLASTVLETSQRGDPLAEFNTFVRLDRDMVEVTPKGIRWPTP